MAKISPAELEKLDADYPGLKNTVLELEAMNLPPCPKCGSQHTQLVQVGATGRTIALAAATDKVHLIPNRPPEGAHFCPACRAYFP